MDNITLRVATVQEADIAFPIGLNRKIYEDIEISPTTELEGVKFLVSSPEELSKIVAIVRTFSYEVWLAMIFTTLITAMISYKIFVFDAKLHKRRTPSLLKILWALIGTFTNQGNELIQTPGLCTRIVVIGWIFPIAILVASYGASLMSFITFPGYKNIPETFEDLIHCIEHKHFTASTMINSAIDNFIQSSTEGIGLRFKKQIEQKRIIALNTDNLNEYERTLQRKHAVIYFNNAIKINAEKMGLNNFVISKDNLFFSIQIWGMRKGFPYKEKINKMLLYCLEAGIYTKFLTDELEKVTIKTEINKKIIYDINHSLNLRDTSGAFSILLTGYILSFFVLLVEKYVTKVKKEDKSSKLM
ncbi:ionotropic receptor 21a-like [Centruroides vittatus]|uniref:ionotropic receptor 21a-like n=1 Tax=Centruroides vittatus TaxID=120091 RepID=UPI00350F34C4